MTETLDGQIVAALRREGRTDVRSLAEETDAIATAVQKHLRALESDGVIEGYAARLAVALDAVDEVVARLRGRREFVTVYRTTGEFTLSAVGKYDSEAAVADCLRDLHDDTNVDAVGLSAVSSVVREDGSPLPGD